MLEGCGENREEVMNPLPVSTVVSCELSAVTLQRNIHASPPLHGLLQPASRRRSGGSGAARGACEARGDKAPRRRPHPLMPSQYRTARSRCAGRFRGSVRVLRHALLPRPGTRASSADRRSADPHPPRPDRVSDVMPLSQEVLHPNTAPTPVT